MLHDQQRIVLRAGYEKYLEDVMSRWDTLHAKRYLISPFADCFVSHDGNLNHATKSRFSKYAVGGNRDIIYPMKELRNGLHGNADIVVSRNLFDSGLRPYATLQVDVMNALHCRGSTGERGIYLENVVTWKMKSVLRPWITGPRSKLSRQIHLHIDGPGLVLVQKRAEQMRRDKSRGERRVAGDSNDVQPAMLPAGIAFHDNLNIPWSSLLTERAHKEELVSFHLFCGAVAAFELLKETQRQCAVFLHRGSFAIPTTFAHCTPSQFKPVRSPQDRVDGVMNGRVFLYRIDEGSGKKAEMFAAPRSRCVMFGANGCTSVGNVDIRHGEAEMRLVAVTKQYISPTIVTTSSEGELGEGGARTAQKDGEAPCQSVIITGDTDVFVIT